jgi:hypothetical protein
VVDINGTSYYPEQLSQADFVNNFKLSWAEALLPLHPEYCKLKFYCTVATSLDYDEQMQKLNHFDEACTTGYLIPFVASYSPPGSGPNPPCTTSVADPFFTLPTVPTATKSAFQFSLTSNFNASGFNIYKASSVNIYNTTSTPPLGSNPCSADMEWVEFRDNYITLKQIYYENLLNAYLVANSNCNASAAPLNYVSRFPNFDVSDLLTEDGINPNNATSANQAAFNSQVNANMAVQCSTECEANKIVWDGDLTNYCPSYTAALQTVKDNILAGLEAICNLGCDINHPDGSSSYNPAGPGYTIPGSGGTIAYNFQDVLNYYLPGACTANIFASPLPFSQSKPADELALNDCKCNQLLQVEYSFNNPPSGGLPPGVNKAWKLFKYQYGYDLAEFNSRLCICKAALTSPGTWLPGYTWTLAEVNKIKLAAVSVDPKLQCDDCLKCSNVVTQLNNLYASLPNQGYTNVYNAVDLDLVNATIAENTLNTFFNKNYGIQDYLDLYEDCTNFNVSSGDKTFGNNVNPQAIELLQYLDAMVKRPVTATQPKYLPFSHPMKLCTDPEYFFSSFYLGTLPLPAAPAASGYQYNVTNPSATQMVIKFNNTTSGLDENVITLDLPGSYTLGWYGLFSFDSIRAYSPPPVIGGPVYSFIIYATDINGAVVKIKGTNTQIIIATLPFTTPIEPMFCGGPPVIVNKNACAISVLKQAMTDAQNILTSNLDDDLNKFNNRYKQICMESLQESFTRQYTSKDKSFTLYYYDEAGNMVRTVQPKGIDVSYLAATTQALPATPLTFPLHSSVGNGVKQNYVNDYKYNSYNQPITENSVDGGATTYLYDKIGRIKASQNAKQLATGNAATTNIYSYTVYDIYGRITEVGEMKTPAPLTLADVSNNSTFTTLLSSAIKRQVIKTVYDRPVTTPNTYAAAVLAKFNTGTQENLRNRVAYVTYEEDEDNNPATYNHASFYSYDEHGNVSEIVEQNNALVSMAQHLKKIEYEYELISGNMNKVTYQKGQADLFMHKYEYDFDNRLQQVYTSRDGQNWDRDAKYIYYEHGPLARVERGDKQVQGTDYYYTINGWIKGINSDALAVNNDVGKDGAATTAYNSAYSSIHKNFARDGMSYGLNYFSTVADEDYSAINRWKFTNAPSNTGNPVSSKTNLTNIATPFNIAGTTGGGGNLFNGNISSMVTNFIDKDPTNLQTDNSPNPQIAAYCKYRLN